MKPLIHSSVHSFIQDTCAEAVPGAGDSVREWTRVTGLTVGMKSWAPREPTNVARCQWKGVTEEVKPDWSLEGRGGTSVQEQA